jgi:hypothetical protein
MKSKFGSRYSQYWNDRMEAATTNKIRKRALDTVDQAHEAVSKRILRSFSKVFSSAFFQ